MDNIKLEILEGSYWEHFKYGKDLSLFLPVDHPKRIEYNELLNELTDQIQKLKHNGHPKN